LYRPTVRYDDVFKAYVDDVFGVTTLDRNQIIRAALFIAAHTPEFRSLLHSYRNGEQNIPVPSWSLKEDGYWKGQTVSTKGEVANDIQMGDGRRGRAVESMGSVDRTTEGRTGEISTEVIPATNGAFVFTAN
jgi:hypothetical protein